MHTNIEKSSVRVIFKIRISDWKVISSSIWPWFNSFKRTKASLCNSQNSILWSSVDLSKLSIQTSRGAPIKISRRLPLMNLCRKASTHFRAIWWSWSKERRRIQLNQHSFQRTLRRSLWAVWDQQCRKLQILCWSIALIPAYKCLSTACLPSSFAPAWETKYIKDWRSTYRAAKVANKQKPRNLRKWQRVKKKMFRIWWWVKSRPQKK